MTTSDIMSEVTLPDKTKLYSYERAREVFKAIDKKEFNVADAILTLLFAQPDKPIHGRISLMKQVFLLTHEVMEKSRIQDPKFVPARYGMYSFLVANTVLNLEFAGYITRQGRKNTRVESFRISDKGKQHIATLFNSLPDDLQTTIRRNRKGWDQLGYEGILRYIYQKHPEYRDTSVFKKRYAPIVWGRGLG